MKIKTALSNLINNIEEDIKDNTSNLNPRYYDYRLIKNIHIERRRNQLFYRQQTGQRQQ